MKANIFFKFFSILFLSLFLSCETDTLENNLVLEEPISLQETFQLQFNLENFEDPVGHIVNNIEVNWDVYETKNFKDKEWYEFKVTQSKPISYSGDGEIQGQFFSVLAHKNNEGIKFFINKMLSFSGGNGFTYFNISEKSYHGMAYLYNLEGEVEHLFHFEKGNLMNSVENIKVNASQVNNLGLISRGDCFQKASTARCDSALACALNGGNNTGTGGGCGSGVGPAGSGGGGGFVQVFTHHYTDFYNDHGNGEYSYNGTTFNGTTSEWVWTSGGGTGYSDTSWNYAETQGSSNPDGYTSSNFNNTTYSDQPPPGQAEEPNRLILNLNDMRDYPCVAEVIKALANGDFKNLTINDFGELETGGNFSQSVLDLFSKSQDYDLAIEIGDLDFGQNGSTEISGHSGSFLLTIKIDKNYARRGTKLAIARTLIHESMHAYLKYIYQEENFSELSVLLSQYRRDYGDIGEHQFMTQFTDVIAHSLAVWDNYSISDTNYYNYLAWSGDMMKTVSFTQLSKALQQKIKEANEAEGSNVDSATADAKGEKCE